MIERSRSIKQRRRVERPAVVRLAERLAYSWAFVLIASLGVSRPTSADRVAECL